LLQYAGVLKKRQFFTSSTLLPEPTLLYIRKIFGNLHQRDTFLAILGNSDFLSPLAPTMVGPVGLIMTS